MFLRKLSTHNSLLNNNWFAALKHSFAAEYAFFGSKLEVPAPPKRPLTAYMIFCKENRPIILRDNPSLSSPEQIKILAEKWSHLSTEMKKPYELSARKNTLQYGEEHKKFYENLTEEQKELLAKMKAEKRKSRRMLKLKRALQESGIPKSATSSFALFVKSQARNKPNDTKIVSEFMKSVADVWKKLPEEVKKSYEEQALADKTRYSREMKEWHDKMVAENRTDLIKAYDELRGRRKSLDDVINAPISTRKLKSKENISDSLKNEEV